MGADAIGFVFSTSPRKVSPKDAKNILEIIPPFVSSVGVFVDEDVKFVEEALRECPVTILQFHGKEPPDYCHAFRKSMKVVKAFRVQGYGSVKDMASYDVDGYLLDTFVEGMPGGTGKAFNWDIALRVQEVVPRSIILSGGLNVDNVTEAIRKVHPYAVDVSSGVEKVPGIKDIQLMGRFIKIVKNLE